MSYICTHCLFNKERTVAKFFKKLRYKRLCKNNEILTLKNGCTHTIELFKLYFIFFSTINSVHALLLAANTVV